MIIRSDNVLDDFIYELAMDFGIVIKKYLKSRYTGIRIRGRLRMNKWQNNASLTGPPAGRCLPLRLAVGYSYPSKRQVRVLGDIFCNLRLLRYIECSYVEVIATPVNS